MSEIIAIVGRPNVGKSTFFNRLTGERAAIVDPTAGVTRDRHYGRSDWCGHEFSVIDTGGLVIGSDDVFESEIKKQAQLAIEESDMIFFMVDAVQGVVPMDTEIASALRRSRKPVFVVVNKVDHNKLLANVAEFYQLGFEQLFPVSAINGSGTGELLDEAVKGFSAPAKEELPDIPKIAVVGKPNVGKSSLINTLLQKERNIVTPIAGTTRDSIYTRYTGFGFDLLLVDTAGIRKKTKIEENIEFYSSLRAIRAIEHSDVCLLMVDATQGIGAQDLSIFSVIQKNHKGVVIVINKWDMISKNNKTLKEFELSVLQKTAPFTDVPVMFTSVINKQRIFKTLEVAMSVNQNRQRKITTSKLNEALLPLIESNPPPALKGKNVKIKYITQLPLHYPAFVFFCNLPQYIKEPYRRFLENKMRKLFDFSGVPLELYFREK